jgi:primosomal protein N' (replication factor Y)
MGAHISSRRLQGGCQTLSTQLPLPVAPRIARVVPDVSGVNKAFDYLVPESVEVSVGSIVRVGLQGRRVTGWVVALLPSSTTATLKPLLSVVSAGPSPEVVSLAQWAARRYSGPLRAVLASASPSRRVHGVSQSRRALGRKSSRTVEPLAAELVKNGRGGVLMWPPVRAVRPVLEAAFHSGPTLVITPSVAFARTIASALRREGLTVAQMPDDWQRAAEGVDVVVGARSAVWAPAPHLACIVVLDEHDERLQDERSPTWHARDVAIERARAAGIPCLLVSPIPTVSAVEWAGADGLLQPSPQGSDWPSIQIVDPYSGLGDEEAPRVGLLSSEVIAELRNPARTVVCVVNTKGRAKLLACKSCHAITRCEQCTAAMIQNDFGVLSCPSCATTRPVVCQNCSGNSLSLLRKGVQRIREEVEAAAGRPALDITADTVVANTTSGVYVGTEAVLHRLSSADVVAFLDFDNELFAPTYRAGEQAWSLIVLASRLLKGAKTPSIILQTNDASSPLVEQFKDINPRQVIVDETQKRRALQLPPFSSMARIKVDGVVGHPIFDDLNLTGIGADVMVAPLQQPGDFLVRASTPESLALALEELRSRDVGKIRCYVDPSRY